MRRYVRPVPLDDAWAGPGRRRSHLPARRRAPARGDGGVRRAHRPRTAPSWSARFVLRDTDLPLVRGVARCRCRSSSPAAPDSWPDRRSSAATLGLTVAGLEIALRDLDDLAGNARRVVAALDELEEPVPVYVELPQTAADGTAGWPPRTSSPRPSCCSSSAPADWTPRRSRRPRSWPAGSTPRWTARRRSSARPACTAPSGTPARTASSTTASSTCWSRPSGRSTAPRATRSSTVLEERDPRMTSSRRGRRRARRWFRSFGSCSVAEPWADLRELGLVR